MRNMVKRTAAGAVLGGSLLVTGGLGIASALPVTNVNDQLVNLGIGNGQVLRDLNVDVASQIAGLLCGTGANVTGTENETNPNGTPATGMSANESTANTSEITALATQVDAGQIPTTTCNSSQGVVTISQNGPVTSPNAVNAPENSPNSVTTPGEQNEGTTPPTATMPAPAGTLGPAPAS
jgi:hypothetical protein